VWGRYRGARTVVAEDNLQIVWDIEAGDAAEVGGAEEGDVLGLVAGDSVVLRRTVGPGRRGAPYGLNVAFAGAGIPPFGGYPLDAPNQVATTWEQPRIVAALVALRGGIAIQNAFQGQEHAGPLRISGSQASRFRGVLRLGGTQQRPGPSSATMGYPVELWSYDRRFASSGRAPGMPLTGGGSIRILTLDVG
jgi:hypothetical protein